MKILAIESSAKAASAAVCEDGALIAQYFQNSGLTHSRTLLKMVQDMLLNLDLTISDIGLIAVASGPGSFTGIRIGVAAAKGLAWGADIPVCGVSTLLAMAHHCAVTRPVVCPVMDARRGEVYNAAFTYENGAYTRLCADRAIPLRALLEEAARDTRPYYLVGDGAQKCYGAFREAGIDASLAPPPLLHQTAWGVASASLSLPSSDAGALVPNYLRLSQAERERLEKQGLIP